MHTTHLRKVGGSIMLPVPPALLAVLKLGAGTSVDLDIEQGNLVVHPRKTPEYTLEELMAQCDFDAPMSDEDQLWLNAPPQGKELI